MLQVVIRRFGGPEVLEIDELPTPEPGPGEVRVRLTSIGMNHAELMARRGQYKIASGEPPFTPGLEAGGIVEAVGPGVAEGRVGLRVILSPDAPRRKETEGRGGRHGTYRSHYVLPAEKVIPAPDNLRDEQLGAVMLIWLTAWGCFVWKGEVGPGMTVALSAASSGAALAAAQLLRRVGAIPYGLTSGPEKVERLNGMPEAPYERVLLTHEPDGRLRPFHRTLREWTGGRGVDLVYDAVGAGPYLQEMIGAVADRGTVWIYGLLGRPDVLNVSPLIRKHADLRGWAVTELIEAGPEAFMPGCREILDGFARGLYRLPVAGTFPFSDVVRAHATMEEGRHIGKFILIP